ncbi:MAG: hypothetical protein AAF616_10360 [Bacteroidota bacterium]
MKKLLGIPMILIVLLFSACSEDGDSAITSLSQDFDLEAEATIESNFEDVDAVVNAGIEAQSTAGRIVEDELLDGADITHDKENNIITIDFGTGVEGPAGRVRKGAIVITYSDLRWTPGAFREVTFQDFSIDDVLVEGTRKLENTTASTDDSPEFTVTLTGGKLTFPDSTTATRTVNKVRTWTRAANPRNDEVTVDGTASGSRRDGASYSVEIVEPILYKRDCRRLRVFVPVAGIKQITAGENVAVLDYGDGTCDNLATLTINDQEPEEIVIRLRGRR